MDDSCFSCLAFFMKSLHLLVVVMSNFVPSWRLILSPKIDVDKVSSFQNIKLSLLLLKVQSELCPSQKFVNFQKSKSPVSTSP